MPRIELNFKKKLWEQSRKKKRERGVIDEIKISRGFPKDGSIQLSRIQNLNACGENYSWQPEALIDSLWKSRFYTVFGAAAPNLRDTFIDSPEFPLEIHIL